jgi:hypothetical protein
MRIGSREDQQKSRIKRVLCVAGLVVLMNSQSVLAAPQPIKAPAAATGFAWQVKGEWLENGRGAALQTGDEIHAASLLLPARLDTTHSITVLMPDGRRYFYECFKREDCARGFRVPKLVGAPRPAALTFIERVRAGLSLEAQDAAKNPKARPAASLPRDEFVALLGADHQVNLDGLASKLANGHYTYDVRSLDRTQPRRYRIALQKTGPSVAVAIPAPGLYVVTVTDDLNLRRIDLFVAAVDAAHFAQYKKKFGDMRAMLAEWNGNYQGWPVHDLQRAYLESLVGNLKPVAASHDATHETPLRSGMATEDSGKTAEPVFTPEAGLMKGDTAIQLRCASPGCTIRYSVDGSQPSDASPVYAAPIMLKGTELTIKAYASMPAKKDSPIVTGVFLIEGSDPN